MKILAKAAHTFYEHYYSRERICLGIIKYWKNVEPRLALSTLKSIEFPKRKDKNEFDFYKQIIEDCKSEDREITRAFISSSFLSRDVRPSADIRVDPRTTVGDLKSILKEEPWTPKENLKLYHVKGRRPLNDESSTLNECGVKERDTLLICMGGSFSLPVYFVNEEDLFHLTIKSCFQTVGDLKDMIYQKTRYPPKDQKLTFFCREKVKDKDDIPLVTAGVVKPYWTEHQYWSEQIHLIVPKLGEY